MTRPRTELSFRTGNADRSTANPARDLARSLAGALRAESIACSDPEDIDYAFALRCHVSGRDFYLLVGYVGDGVREWLVSVTPGLGWIRRLFGADDTAELQSLTAVLHRIVTSSDETTDVRWYTLDGWNRDPDGSWTADPSDH